MSSNATERRHKIARLRTKGWAGFLSALGTVAGISVALFFWANGSAIGALIGVAAAVVFAAVVATVVVSNKREGTDPTLDKRMARLRRARYRSAYPRPDSDKNS
jgi:mannitol-specific phosphotransferase system IIBC component